MEQKTLTSTVKHPNNEYYDIELLAYIPTREINEDVIETGIMINPIEVYRINNDQGSSAPEGQIRYDIIVVDLPDCLGSLQIVKRL